MIIIFLVLNTIIFLCTSLGILMLSNNLKGISRSIEIYLDPKAYRPESEVRLISLLLDKYSRYDNKELVDLDSLIMDCFYSNRIGKFKVSVVETLVVKGRRLLWMSITAMVIFETITVGLGQSSVNSVIIIISAGFGAALGFFELHSDIGMGKKQLFLKIKNYISNEYPQIKQNQKEKEEVSFLLTKIDQLESKIMKYEKARFQQKQEKMPKQEENGEYEKPQEEKLQEEDIALILKNFHMFT